MGSHQSPKAPISQGGDDQTGGVPEVLEPIVSAGIDDLHDDVALRFAGLGLLVPVVSQLGEPLELVLRLDPFLDDLGDDIPIVHVEHDQGGQSKSV